MQLQTEINHDVNEHAANVTTAVSVDKLTLLWRYPPDSIEDIVARADGAISCDASWYTIPWQQAGCAARIRMALPDDDGQPSAQAADLQICRPKFAQHGFVRIEWNPAKASAVALAYILHELAAFLPETQDELLPRAYVTRIDLAVDVPGISCRDLAAQRASHHKNAEVHVGASGHVNSIRIGARGSSARMGTFLRVYDKPLPDFDDQMGVRAEVEVRRSGALATMNEIDNPFEKFCIYHFPPAMNRGLFGCFISTVREKGAKRALAMISNDKALAAEFQAILDQCAAPWWKPETLWDKATDRTVEMVDRPAPASPSDPTAHAA
jgi:hypothetical protein